ncbi:DUF2190 family protein [uncultured Paraglaciecola sp.]|uniref:DUF2190 family protein n=1 Tax=uncultured Paraglaciecola sp. TaxID=1765024 RepID=UPI002616EA9A|nr:DUF2190 family protein [uncultured Paraglaciecola sp.]
MPNINSFEQAPEKGSVDLSFHGSVVSARVKEGESAALTTGQGVQIVDNDNGIPDVTAMTADTQFAFGFITRNVKDVSYAAEKRCEVAMQGTAIYLEAGAAIARGANVEYDVSADKVITSAGTNPICGYAYDKAAADGDLIRVILITPKLVASV